MTDAQARLIAAALALIAGAVLAFVLPHDRPFNNPLLIVAGILFMVEYVRTQWPKPGVPS